MKVKYMCALLAFFGLITALPMVYGQLGEQAGQPTLNVSLGSSTTFNYTILNSGSTPINYSVILPTLNTIPNNATPAVTVSPMNGTLLPHSQQEMTIDVSMPSGDKTGLKWLGIVQVVEINANKNSSAGIGATINAGIAKILTIYSVAAKPLPFIVIAAIVVVIILVVVAVAYLLIRRKKVHNKRKRRAR